MRWMRSSMRRSSFVRTPAHQRRQDTLEYLQAMLGQLRIMAEAERCDMLSYLVEMAYIEASDILRGERPLRVRQEKRDSAA